MDISKKHIEFIQQIAKGVVQEEAYRTTIGNQSTTKASAKAQGSKLCKRYAKEIAEAKEKFKKAVEGASNTKEAKNALKSILKQAEVDRKLCDIIEGKFMISEVGLYLGKPVKFKRKPNANEVAKAIDLYNKRFGSNAPIKTDLTSNGKTLTAPTIIIKRNIIEKE